MYKSNKRKNITLIKYIHIYKVVFLPKIMEVHVHGQHELAEEAYGPGTAARNTG